MKYLIILSFILASCQNNKLSESDKAAIEFSIDLHNLKNNSAFITDSIHETAKIDIEFIKKSRKTPDGYIESHLAVFSNDWNKPYKIEKDRFLTFDSYLQYCKAYNYDPKEYASTLGK